MGAIAAVMFGVKAIGDVAGGVMDSNAQREQAKYQKYQSETNARLAEGQAADAIKEGDYEANALSKRAGALRGTQRTSYAAQGINVNTGVAAEVQSDTDALSKIDEARIKENAWRKAWGYKVEALNTRTKGELAYIGGNQAATTTLLTGGMRGLGSLLDSGRAAGLYGKEK